MFGKNRQNPPGPDGGLIYADAAPGGQKKKTARRRRWLLILTLVQAVILLVLAAQLWIGLHVRDRQVRYANAQSLLAEKEYEAAAAEFQALALYRDSQAMARQLQELKSAYKAASDLAAKQRYDEAIAAFRALGDYADSAEQAAYRVNYRKALDLLAETDAGQTQLLTRILSSDVRLADDNGYPAIVGYEAAAALFENLGGYADAPEMADRCYLSAARVKLRWDDPEGALAYGDKLSAASAAILEAEYQDYLTTQTEGP